MYTSHGHQIPGSPAPAPGANRPSVARCGGPRVCGVCKTESNDWARTNLGPDAHMISIEADGTNSVYPEIARDIAYHYIKDHLLEKTDDNEHFVPANVFIVWFTKTLQHWKALVSTTLPDGRYYELTHNGDTGETYVDTYVKVHNVVIPPGGRLEKGSS